MKSRKRAEWGTRFTLEIQVPLSLGIFGLIYCCEKFASVADRHRVRSSHANPVEYGSGLLKALPSTVAVLFPCVTPHPPISIVHSMSYTWSVTCYSLLCFVDRAQQHPSLWKGLLDILVVQINMNSGADRRESWKGTWGFPIAIMVVKGCWKEPNPATWDLI